MTVEVAKLMFDDVLVLKPKRFGDKRGYFSETYNERAFAAAGVSAKFVQDNQSLSAAVGTIRGLHFQSPPHAQAKLVRVVRGKVLDVIVDVKRGSPTFGKWTSIELSAEEGNQVFVPVGYAHGFCTLEPDTEVLYKVTDFYSFDHEYGIRWNDPALGISWPVADAAAVLSDKDRVLPLLKDSPQLL